MKVLLCTILALAAVGCATNDHRVVMSEETASGGIVTYAEAGIMGAAKTPKEIAVAMMEAKCPSGYTTTKTTKEIKTEHFGLVAGNLTYITDHFLCK